MYLGGSTANSGKTQLGKYRFREFKAHGDLRIDYLTEFQVAHEAHQAAGIALA